KEKITMMLATIIDQNHKLRIQVAKQKRQLKAMHYPQVFIFHMAIWFTIGLLLGCLIFGGR
ncbi:MAG: hypothetical protein IKD10_00570, partial [Lentisphaeria bacterium]|nr:hypothetical protein [Lentisphaeria bacterium]